MRAVSFISLLCACSCMLTDAFVPSAKTCTPLHQPILVVNARLHAQTPDSDSKRSKKVMDAAGFAKLTQRLQAEAVREHNSQASEEASSSKGAAVARYAAISAALFAPLFFGSPLLQRPALAVSHEAVAQGECMIHAQVHLDDSAPAACCFYHSKYIL
jgi:hypothetical protein